SRAARPSRRGSSASSSTARRRAPHAKGGRCRSPASAPMTSARRRPRLARTVSPPADHPSKPGHWTSPPRDLGASPEHRLLGREAGGQLQKAIDSLPANQRLVLTLRDVEG